MLKMKRKLQTCDSEDMDIEEGSTFMIFAWNKEDPSNGDNNWQYHGPNRVTKTALLLDYKETDISQQANSLPPDVQTFQITPSNVRNIFLMYINRIHLQIKFFLSLKSLKWILITIVKSSNYHHPKLTCI